jgi:hypothetical protein
MRAAIPAILPTIHLVAVCLDCKRRHDVNATPAEFPVRMAEWEIKHRGHVIEFHTPLRKIPRGIDERVFEANNKAPWWLEFAPNADIKLAYASSAAFTITLASLATSATLVAGQESTAVSNTTNKYLDYLIGGKITTGTTPTTAKTIQIWAYGSVEDTPTYPDVIDGTDSAETMTSVDIRNASLNFLLDTANDATSNRVYWFKPTSLAAAFGGLVPKNFGLWVTHDTVAALNATGTNHALYHTGIYATSV